MTEGIIQKVFAKYYTNGFEVDIDDNTVNVIPQSTLEDAFKELISEIKNYHFDNDKYFDDTIKQTLIGDNQE